MRKTVSFKVEFDVGDDCYGIAETISGTYRVIYGKVSSFRMERRWQMFGIGGGSEMDIGNYEMITHSGELHSVLALYKDRQQADDEVAHRNAQRVIGLELPVQV